MLVHVVRRSTCIENAHARPSIEFFFDGIDRHGRGIRTKSDGLRPARVEWYRTERKRRRWSGRFRPRRTGSGLPAPQERERILHSGVAQAPLESSHFGSSASTPNGITK